MMWDIETGSKVTEFADHLVMMSISIQSPQMQIFSLAVRATHSPNCGMCEQEKAVQTFAGHESDINAIHSSQTETLLGLAQRCFLQAVYIRADEANVISQVRLRRIQGMGLY